MSDDGALFGEEPPAPHPGGRRPGVAQWQTDRLQEALVASEPDDEQRRQALVSDVVGHSVDALRDLTPTEVRMVHEHLQGARSPRSTSSGSAWDDRAEDTWIDKL